MTPFPFSWLLNDPLPLFLAEEVRESVVRGRPYGDLEWQSELASVRACGQQHVLVVAPVRSLK
ncbi:hypothetical protein SAMN06265222_1272 [Neorhodopirellula lusitana]|uniref:Uncharacterized protein n=1 Tax=Neorhodopirellula lusitana TaxID=445327 RepID=A0ABY1QRW8_9BACT|nr:hypothetical protein SAMN06265222_1272 [Neorhodopirellula lusitana]